MGGPERVPVLGAVRRMDDLHTPSRHLGLVPAAEVVSRSDGYVLVEKK